ncbi:glycosyltransferase [Priestia megaterium]|uniref:glycosyltransferase n=1 Tax=Priestia megaterium TaxID=1404 RepID=UPI0034D492A4
MSSFISLCMIVRNEERVLKRCLESIKDYVDEIIIVDTGSIDNTKNIASAFTTNVYNYKWHEDFAAARNFAQSKATGKWIIYLDADEYVDRENMKETVQHLKSLAEVSEDDGFVVTQINFVGTLAGNVTQCPTVRIYKNSSQIKFKGKIHEQLSKSEEELSIGFLELNIYHSGYLSHVFKDKDKTERNIPLIQEEMAKEPKNGFNYYNLANEYLADWKVEEALSLYQQAFQLIDSINILWVPMAVERIIFCLIELKRFNEALVVIEDAIEYWPHTADFKSQRALIYFMQNRFKDSEKELNELIQYRSKYTTVQSLSYLEYLPFFLSGRIYEYRNDSLNAVYNYSQALNYNNQDIETLKRLYTLLIKNEDKKNIIRFINRNKFMNNDISRTCILKIFLDMYEFELVENLLSEWRIQPSDSVRIKLNIAKGKFNFASSILNKNSLNEVLNEGWTDLYDVAILALQLEKTDLFSELLEEHNVEDLKCLAFLFNEESVLINANLKHHLIVILERCILLKNFKLIDLIIQKIVDKDIQNEVGDLFYKYGFENIAFEFYEEATKRNLLQLQSYTNIIEYFVQNENDDNALQWAFVALEQGQQDFRIYETIIELLIKRNAIGDVEKIVEMALNIYPDSDYLHETANKLVSSI